MVFWKQNEEIIYGGDTDELYKMLAIGQEDEGSETWRLLVV